MNIVKLPLEGAFLLKPEPISDNRGYFLRTFDQGYFASKNMPLNVVQTNVSFNHQKATLRGLHFQCAPHEEIKLVQCTQGAIFDVIVDLREGSPTQFQWYGAELTMENRHMFYIPKDFAHGFITLENNSLVSYHMGESYHPGSARGIRWNDPQLNIAWPLQPEVMSDRDRSLPTLQDGI